MAVSDEDSVSFETMLLGDSLIGECIAAENFEFLLSFGDKFTRWVALNMF